MPEIIDPLFYFLSVSVIFIRIFTASFQICILPKQELASKKWKAEASGEVLVMVAERGSFSSQPTCKINDDEDDVVYFIHWCISHIFNWNKSVFSYLYSSFSSKNYDFLVFNMWQSIFSSIWKKKEKMIFWPLNSIFIDQATYVYAILPNIKTGNVYYQWQ